MRATDKQRNTVFQEAVGEGGFLSLAVYAQDDIVVAVPSNGRDCRRAKLVRDDLRSRVFHSQLLHNNADGR